MRDIVDVCTWFIYIEHGEQEDGRKGQQCDAMRNAGC